MTEISNWLEMLRDHSEPIGCFEPVNVIRVGRINGMYGYRELLLLRWSVGHLGWLSGRLGNNPTAYMGSSIQFNF